MKLIIDIDERSYKIALRKKENFPRDLSRVEYMIANGEPYQDWIPVSERLPTKEEYIANNGLFIVSDGNRNYAEYFDIYDSKKFGELIVFGFRVDKCVIAWMPLPVEPYKAESEE